MPVDVALALEQATAAMPVTEHMAAMHDSILLRLPEEDAVPEWLGHLPRIGKEAGDVFNRAGEFLADDGEIDEFEAPLLLKEVDELLMAVAAMRIAVRARLPDRA